MRPLPRLRPLRTHRTSHAGRTRWRHFTGMLAAALTVLTVMVIGVFQGVLPVSAALRGKQNIKLSITQVTGYATGSFPKFFQNRDGDNQPVVVIGLQKVSLQGLCASGKVNTPLGAYVIRFASNPGGPPI